MKMKKKILCCVSRAQQSFKYSEPGLLHQQQSPITVQCIMHPPSPHAYMLGSKPASRPPDMGICQSFEVTAAAAVPTASMTAKVVFQDGKLEEYNRPVTASHVLNKSPSSFICNADDMELGDFLSALSADDELHPGQLYFLLPLSMLRRRLQPEDMAALAVRASSALVNGCRYPVWLPAASRPASASPRAAAPQRKRDRRRGASGRSFASSLSSIPEWDPDPPS